MGSHPFFIQHCPAVNRSACDADQADTGDYGITNSGDFRTLAEEGININTNATTITLKTDVLCKNSNQFDCHVHIDHMNLSNKQLHVETTNSRSVVLHVEQPVTYPDDPKITRSITLTGSAELCSVNPSSSICNRNPEQLVIMATSGTAPTDSCNTQVRSVSFTNSNLPYALLSSNRNNPPKQCNTKRTCMGQQHLRCR